MSRKKKVTAEAFERVGEDNLSCRVFRSMMVSPAYMSLSSKAKELYSYMKLQQYGQAKVDDPENKNRCCFYFNKAMWLDDDEHSKGYKLYKAWWQFDRDKTQLVEHGFIDVVEDNHTTRDKNIYCFSSRWKLWSG